MCVYMLWCACWRSEDYSNFSSTVGSWDWTKLSGLCSRCLYLSAEPQVMEVLKIRFWIIQNCWEPKDLPFFCIFQRPQMLPCAGRIETSLPCLPVSSQGTSVLCLEPWTPGSPSWEEDKGKQSGPIHLASPFILRYESPSCAISLCAKEVGVLF